MTDFEKPLTWLDVLHQAMALKGKKASFLFANRRVSAHLRYERDAEGSHLIGGVRFSEDDDVLFEPFHLHFLSDGDARATVEDRAHAAIHALIEEKWQQHSLLLEMANTPPVRVVWAVVQ